jgi:L-seryl-tRNA(Ser) seleniumtransferase
MSSDNRRNIFRAIPPANDLLSHERIRDLAARHPRFPWTEIVRTALDAFRSLPDPAARLASPDRAGITRWVVDRVCAQVSELRSGGLRRVLNGTGVVLHTNLGRAPWGDGAVEAARSAMAGYVSLEVDLETGERSKRGVVLSKLLELATGAESVMTVNNNAAAVYLAINSWCPPGRVLVSRGELVEIGGSFRLPEILHHAAAEVVEVGTTNRTYADDYLRAARGNDVILKVHKSNYAIEGFAHEASIAELAAVADETGAWLVYDMGSGTFFDFHGEGVGSDPVVAAVIAEGVDAVTMSADKLLGGAQAGIIAGSRKFLAGISQNPLRRATRIDKVTIAALQEVIRSYLFASDVGSEVPAVAQILSPAQSQRARAEKVLASITAPEGIVLGVEGDSAAVGGGSFSSEVIPSAALVIRCARDEDATRLARSMRLGDPPLFPRVKGAAVRINMSTILEGEEDLLHSAINAALDA